MITIGYLGPVGTFTEEALHYYQDTLSEPVITQAFSTIDDTIDACMQGVVDYAFVPVENSLGGSVINTMDYVMEHEDIEICSEIVMPIRHYLWAVKPIPLAEVTAIYSHPQALRQCKQFLQTQMQHAQLRETDSTASGGSYVHDHPESLIAAIGGVAMGHTYGLVPLTETIQDVSHNLTRFLVLRPNENIQFTPESVGEKISLLCELDGLRPGSLHEALGIFSSRHINLVRIESRPTKGRLGEYKFFFDLDTTTGAQNVYEALEALKALATHYQLFGAYHTLFVK